jgi:hypothetical protein
MKRALLILVVLASACTPMQRQKPQSKATEVEIDLAKERYLTCLIPFARRYDDYISDANTVAAAMVGACSVEFDRFSDLILQGDNDYVKREVRRKNPVIQQKQALGVVLDLRKSAIKAMQESKKANP